MSKTMLKLKAEARESGKAAVPGVIRAVMYGPKNPTASIAVSEAEFNKIWKAAGESTVVTLECADGEHDTLIHDIARNPVTDAITHVDFYAVDKNVKVSVAVPIEFIGVSPAVKDLGGILIKVMHELEIEALPKDLPHGLEVDISSLVDFQSHITAGDIVLPSGVSLTVAPEEIVALVNEAKEEVEEATAPIDMDAIGLSVEKGKKEEEGDASAEKSE
jgi:large subunit ribosomal protein L25